jgi:hypothetical protein
MSSTGSRNGNPRERPIGAGRYRQDLDNGFGLTAYDFGGFGADAHVTWQVLGTLVLRIKHMIHR